MAKRKFSRKKRSFKKRKFSRKRSSRVMRRPRIPRMFDAKSVYVKMRYCANIIIPSSGSQLNGTYILRCNDTYDPDYTGTFGGQPSCHDEAYLRYDHGTVVGAKLTVIGANTSTINGVIGIRMSDDLTLITSQEQARESKLGHYKFMPLNQDLSFKLTSKFSASKFFGKPKGTIVGDALYRQSGGASPTENAYWHIWASPGPVVTTALPDISVMIQIDYTVIMTEPKPISLS